MKTKLIILAVIFTFPTFIEICQAQKTIHININYNRKTISPYIYGRNNSLSDNSGEPLSNSDWQFLKDAGVRSFRENGGNNFTKYNWRRKLLSKSISE